MDQSLLAVPELAQARGRLTALVQGRGLMQTEAPVPAQNLHAAELRQRLYHSVHIIVADPMVSIGSGKDLEKPSLHAVQSRGS